MFSCVACGNVAATPHHLREGLVCADCAAFLLRSEEQFQAAEERDYPAPIRITVVA